MGFECGFSVVSKKDGIKLTHEMIKSINEYYSYFENDWAKEHFNSAEEYLKNYEYEVFDKSIYEAYKDEYLKDGDIEQDLVSYCSNGKPLTNTFGEEDILIDSKEELLKYILKIIRRFQWFNIVMGYPQSAYVVNEDFSKVSKQCDGIYISPEEDDEFVTPSYEIPSNIALCFSNNEDEDYSTEMFVFWREMLVNLIKWYDEIDFSKQYIYYWVSY